MCAACRLSAVLLISIFTDLRNVYTCLEVSAQKPFVKGKTAGSGCSWAVTLLMTAGYNSDDTSECANLERKEL